MVGHWGIHLKRLGIGALAGFCAALVKYLKQDHSHILAIIATEQRMEVPWLFLGYGIGAVALLILGAIVSWVSHEDSIPKLFAIGLSAPAMLTTAISPTAAVPVQPPVQVAPAPMSTGELAPFNFVVSTAMAQTQEECIKRRPFVRGFRLFLGIPDKYRIVAGSYKDKREAVESAQKINAEASDFKASVGLRQCDNPYYPVIIDGELELAAARVLLERAKRLASVPSDSYLSLIN